MAEIDSIDELYDKYECIIYSFVYCRTKMCKSQHTFITCSVTHTLGSDLSFLFFFVIWDGHSKFYKLHVNIFIYTIHKWSTYMKQRVNH